MDRKIDLDLFARLMRHPSTARQDMLEFMGQGSALTEHCKGPDPRVYLALAQKNHRLAGGGPDRAAAIRP